MLVELLEEMFFLSLIALLLLFGMVISYISGVSYASYQSEESKRSSGTWAKPGVTGVGLITLSLVVFLHTGVYQSIDSEYADYRWAILILGVLYGMCVILMGRFIQQRKDRTHPDLEREEDS